jgi:uncharacterized protein (DUF1786 family)
MPCLWSTNFFLQCGIEARLLPWRINFGKLLPMKNILAIDIGAGTMDLLCYDPIEEMHYKAVVKSPVRTMAASIAATTGNLVVSGVEMGGGPVTETLIKRARTANVKISSRAAATLHHDPARVKAMGIEMVSDENIAALKNDPAYTPIQLQDIDAGRIQQIVEGFGLPFEFEAVAVCAQDHGAAPAGVSHLEFRHRLFKERLDKHPYPHTLMFTPEALPNEFNRLNSIAQAAARLPTREVFVMDSGMAAILGASLDPSTRPGQTLMVLDVATSHTVGAVLTDGMLQASFEYHTHDITLQRLEQLMKNLPEGKLRHAQILAEGGHGAYLKEAPGAGAVEAIIATGPKRRLLVGSSLPITWGAPWGDNMMTGCVGLLEALFRRRNKSPLGLF